MRRTLRDISQPNPLEKASPERPEDRCGRQRPLRQEPQRLPLRHGQAGRTHHQRVRQHFGFISLGFLADAIGRRPTAMLWYTMSLVLTPLVYLWGASWGFAPLLVLVGAFGFFTL